MPTLQTRIVSMLGENGPLAAAHLQAPHGTQFGRTLVVLGEGAELTFIEGCRSAPRAEPSLHCAVGEFVLGPGARLNYLALQDCEVRPAARPCRAESRAE